MNKKIFSNYIKNFDFKNLFINLGWDNYNNKIPFNIDDVKIEINGIVEKRGFVIVVCSPNANGDIPSSNLRKKIEKFFSKYHQEHLIIYQDLSKTRQVWQFVVQEPEKPKRIREIPYNLQQDPEILFQRARGLLFSLDEEENITLIDVIEKFKKSFGKNTEKVTKKFYAEFKKQHNSFLDFISGIDDNIQNSDNKNKQWYASLMLNRLMFCYFIQKRGYLDNNIHYLQNKLNEVKKQAGNDNFFCFYRNFLLQLFHQGLGQPENLRNLTVNLGKIPYLNGGLFDVHELEKLFDNINIKDDAFQKIFEFFDQWNWHLDTSIEATGKDINPDVIGYIFEKYINDRAAMGAYYTKEDITEYIGKNTIIPFIFDKVKTAYPKAFDKNGFIWSYLKNSTDIYIYDSVKFGIPETGELFHDLPEDIKTGFCPNIENKVVDDSAPHLFEIRKSWNKKAPSEIALPTETFRELIERRKRYADINSKIANGEIFEINDFITFNLNIRQFIQDIIENSDDPDLIRHFYKAIRSLTILDPTCGSGAFLFAALNILEPIYEACIERMEQFTAEEPRKHKFFLETLAEANSIEHPNLQYYIYKSIILNNLYGVDIMHEAVEIAKLRLFLKMVGAVDINIKKDNFGLEPLPDIDFNIRAGNTLVGFATENEFKNAVYESEPIFADKIIKEFEDEFDITAVAFKHFQNSQLVIDKGENSYKNAKADLQKRLNKLNDKLNGYLASAYGIDKNNISNKLEFEKKYNEWIDSHQPFHWFAEFYAIINGNKGFDVVIGNPPYVEYSKVKKVYQIKNYETEKAGNLYAFVVERSIALSKKLFTRSSMIIPHSAICTDRMSELQDLLLENNDIFWVSTYGIRPAKLFVGVDQRLAIYLLKSSNKKQEINYSSSYHRWHEECRKHLFSQIQYSSINCMDFKNSLPKIDNQIDCLTWNKLQNLSQLKSSFSSKNANSSTAYFHNAPRYWIRSMTFAPYFWNERDGEQISVQVKSLHFPNETDAKAITAILNSSLFYWWFIILSDCRHLNMREIELFPVGLDKMTDELKNKLSKITKKLMADYKKNAHRKECEYKTTGKVIYDEFYPKKSKPIIDEIDKILAKHYGFTAAELDFIINYDIKYRMGKELDNYISGILSRQENTKKLDN